VLLDDTDSLESSLGGILDVLLVVRVTAEDRTEPASKCGKDFRVKERTPLDYGGVAGKSISKVRVAGSGILLLLLGLA